jgi:Fe-S cluster assembly iron-binding protein IscA
LGLALDEPNDEDKVFDHTEFKLVVNAQELENIGDVEVDFRDSRWGSGFTVRSTFGSTCS